MRTTVFRGWNRRTAIALAVFVLGGCARFEPRPVEPGQTASLLEQRSLADPGLRSFLEQNLGRSLANWPPPAWDEEMLTLVAFYFHPSLDVARAQWRVAQGGIRTAGGRPNPVATILPGSSLNKTGTSAWIPFGSIDVPIETAGKRGYRIALASHLSEAARLRLAAAAWQVLADLRAGLLDYSAARQRARLLEQQLQLQRQILALLEERLKAGAIARTDLILPRLALTRAEVDYADALRQAAADRVRIADALGLPVKGIEGAEFDFPLAVPAEAGQDLTSGEARRQALLGRSDVLAGLAEYAASQSALQLEIAKQYPDVHLNPGYQFDEGEHKWTLGLTMEVPVLNRNQGPIAEAKAKREQSAALFIALQAKVIAQIDAALAARAAAVDQLRRQGQLTRLALEQSASAQALFNAGAADKLELTSAQLEASASNLAFLDAQSKVRQALAQLEDATQRPLHQWPSLEQGRPAQANPKEPQ